MLSNLKRHLHWVILAGMLMLVFACKKTSVSPAQPGLYSDPKSLFSLISNNFNLSHYDTALLLSGLDSVLASGKGSYTAFVVQDENYPTDGWYTMTGAITYPTGGNFYGRGYNQIDRSYGLTNFYYWYVQQGNIPYLKRVAGYHIVTQKLSIADIPFGYNKGYATLAGDSVFISKYMDATGATVVTVNGIRVVRQDFQASNGVYHVLSQLLFPDPNTSTWAILSGTNVPGWAFEPIHLNTYQNPCCGPVPPPHDTLGFSMPTYNYGTFATALTRTGLYKLLLDGPGAYTVLAVPNNYFINPYVNNYYNPPMTQQQVLTMNLDTLTSIMKLHILPGRYFMSDFQSYPYNASVLDTVSAPGHGQYTFSKPMAFPTIGKDSVYVIPNGLPIGNSTPGFYIYGQGNLLYSPYLSNLANQFARVGMVGEILNDADAVNNGRLLPQDVVAPNGVIQYLYTNELVPR
jgi:uncharacterized surface protein with fasciclin (FAS1) repeats